MKCIARVLSGALLFGTLLAPPIPAGAQDESEVAPETSTEAESETKRSPYYRKVRGWLWLEAVAGVSSYDPDQFGKLGSAQDAPRRRGPEYGFALGTAFGGPFFLGFFYRQANYDAYKLLKTGLDMQGNLRFIPYVHPILRASIGYARTFDGSPYGFENDDSAGVSFTGGLGVRIPIVRWMSFATTFDWTFVAMVMRGDPGGTTEWVSGQQFGATFALTFHFIGVRKD
jgi:hypothetical protein